MAITFNCTCGQRISAPDHLAGKAAKCPGCGQALQVPAPAGEQLGPSTADLQSSIFSQQTAAKPAARRGGAAWYRAGWLVYLLIGLPLGLLPFLTYPTRYCMWLLSAVVHEGGHWIVNLYRGCAALPRIRLDGHADTISLEPGWFIGLISFGVLSYWTYRAWRSRSLWQIVPSTALLVLMPVTVFWDGLGQSLTLMAGHGAECIIGGVLLYRAMTGLYVQGRADRIASSLLGWNLLLANIWMFLRLGFSTQAQFEYTRSGSFGHVNDFAQLADLWGWPLGSTCKLMLFLALLTLPIITLLAWPDRDQKAFRWSE